MTNPYPALIAALRDQIAADYSNRHPMADAEHCAKAASGMIGAVCRVIRIEQHETVARYAGGLIDATKTPAKFRRELRRSRQKIDGTPAEDYADDVAAALPLILQIVALRIREAGDRMKAQDAAEATRMLPPAPRGKHFTDKLAGRA